MIGNTFDTQPTCDRDVPVALRKRVRTCTKHLVAKFVAYGHLSTSVQALVSNLSKTEEPTDIHEAWADPKWKQAVLDELLAKLVAKEYTQTYSIDYQETFAPVAKINSVKVLMSLDANLY